MPRFEQWLRRHGAMAVGLLSPLIAWWVWGQVDPLPVIHDEASYVLQADIFATGRWTAPPPPIPEFFEQPHVQVVPRVASKYPPGHALLLSLGALVGLPALVPLLLTGLAAALLFRLATRVTNPWVAMVAWPTWLFSTLVLRFQPSYMSEVTTTVLVLASWWCLLTWRESRRSGWLFGLALAIGWGAITRPLTMLVFAIPIGVVVIRDVLREKRWHDFGIAMAIGIAILAILPLWSARTTGSWRVAPVAKYRVDYLPFDRVGFTADTTAPGRRAAMSRVLDETYAYFLDIRKQQTLGALPRTFGSRVLAVVNDVFGGARLPLLVLAVVGLVVAPPTVRFAAVSALLLLLAYLPYAHWAPWTVYYLEIVPVLAALTGLGALAVVRRLGDHRSAVGATAMAGLITFAGVFGAAQSRNQRLSSATLTFHRQIDALLPRLPSPGILFVRYSSRIPQNPAIVRNSADLAAEPMWIVHDLGARDDELRRLAPTRASHSLDIDRLVRGRAGGGAAQRD